MNKSLKITLLMEQSEGFLRNIVQKHAKAFELEGVAHNTDSQTVKIIICGKRDHVDSFIETLHKETERIDIKDIEIEPFLKDKDYRGVFRVIA